jgi:hypothetical protein
MVNREGKKKRGTEVIVYCGFEGREGEEINYGRW